MKPTLDSIVSAKAKLAEELRQLEQQEEDLRREQSVGAFSKVIELLNQFGSQFDTKQKAEIAALVAFIASEAAAFMTGSNVAMNGGQHMS